MLGGKCGSTYIDKHFYKPLSGWFGKKFISLAQDHRGPDSKFMVCFEDIKREFGEFNDHDDRDVCPFVMSVKDSLHYDLKRKTVTLS